MCRLCFAFLIGLLAAGACSGKNATVPGGGAGTSGGGTGGAAGTTGAAGMTGAAATTGAAGATGAAATTGLGGTTGAAGTIGAAGTRGSAGATGAAGGTADAAVDRAPTVFEEQALEIAAEYIAWGRVDDELRWAPFLCRIPYPGIARASQSNDEATHGHKLYSVFAKNHAAYPNGPQDGQVVVKQSWIPELVPDADGGIPPTHFSSDSGIDADHFYPYAKGDGGTYRAATPAGLFIMFRVDRETPDTDEGWVYATVSAAGQVTAAGRVASCMGCHETSATHERLFGVPLSPSAP